MKRKDLVTLAESLGATVDEDSNGRTFTLKVEAPQRRVWKSDGVHELVESSWEGDAAWREQTRQTLADRMRLGTEPCVGSDCEWCE